MPVQNDRVRFRNVPRFVRRKEFVHSLFRQFLTQGVTHELIPAGQFHEHAGERRFILRDKLDIRGIRRIAGVHRTLPAVQSADRFRPVQSDRHGCRFIPCPVDAVEGICTLLRQLRAARIACEHGTARHLYIADGNGKVIRSDILDILRIRKRRARIAARSAVECTGRNRPVQCNGHGHRLVSGSVCAVKVIGPLLRHLRPVRVTRVQSRTGLFHIARGDPRNAVVCDILDIARVRERRIAFHSRAAVNRTRRFGFVERDRHRRRTVSALVHAVELVFPFRCELCPARIVCICRAARHLDIAVDDPGVIICRDVLYIRCVRIGTARFRPRAAVQCFRRKRRVIVDLVLIRNIPSLIGRAKIIPAVRSGYARSRGIACPTR